jgi:uncharacterized membrane protein
MPWTNQTKPTVIERVVGGVCYFTFGLAGIIYIILSGRSGQSDFFRFHFLQSIVLSILGILFGWMIQAFLKIATAMLLTFGTSFSISLVNMLAFTCDAFVKAAYLLLIYGMLWAFMGKYAEIPFISNIVRRQMH